MDQYWMAAFDGYFAVRWEQVYGSPLDPGGLALITYAMRSGRTLAQQSAMRTILRIVSNLHSHSLPGNKYFSLPGSRLRLRQRSGPP